MVDQCGRETIFYCSDSIAAGDRGSELLPGPLPPSTNQVFVAPDTCSQFRPVTDLSAREFFPQEELSAGPWGQTPSSLDIKKYKRPGDWPTTVALRGVLREASLKDPAAPGDHPLDFLSPLQKANPKREMAGVLNHPSVFVFLHGGYVGNSCHMYFEQEIQINNFISCLFSGFL